MTKPKITLITPTIGRSLLKRSIQSVIDCKYRDMEHILVTDKSKKNDVMNILKEFDHTYTLIVNETPMSPAQAKNKGHDIAQGKYITWIDDDDICYRGKFFTLSEYLDTHDNVFGVFGKYSTTDVKTGKVKKKSSGGHPNPSFDSLVQTNYIGSGSIMFRNTPEVRFPENLVFGEDYRLWLNMIAQHPIVHINEVVYSWTHNTASGFTSKKEFDNWRELVKKNQEDAIKQWRGK